MNIDTRLKHLEAKARPAVDIAAVILESRARFLRGESLPAVTVAAQPGSLLEKVQQARRRVGSA